MYYDIVACLVSGSVPASGDGFVSIDRLVQAAQQSVLPEQVAELLCDGTVEGLPPQTTQRQDVLSY